MRLRISWSSTTITRLLRDIISDTWESYKCVNWVFSPLHPPEHRRDFKHENIRSLNRFVTRSEEILSLARSFRYWHWILSAGSIFSNVLCARNWYVRFYCGKHLRRNVSFSYWPTEEFAKCALCAQLKLWHLFVSPIYIFRDNFRCFEFIYFQRFQ